MSSTPKLPPGCWDSHVHVVDEDKFPLHPKHSFRPPKADLDDLLAFQRTQNVDHVCLVAFSVYHDDNRCLLDALGRLGGRGRGVVCIDPDTITESELRHMHDLGARGVRVNLKTNEQRLDYDSYDTILSKYAKLLRPLGWAIQIFIALDQVKVLNPIILSLDMPVVFDHLGAPLPDVDPAKQEGYAEFMELLKNHKVYTKLSGTYRFPDMPNLDKYVKDILAIAGDRVVYASDWPHSKGPKGSPDGDRNKMSSYREIDDAGFKRQCIEWCGNDQELVRKVFRDNARRLWSYDRDD